MEIIEFNVEHGFLWFNECIKQIQCWFVHVNQHLYGKWGCKIYPYVIFTPYSISIISALCCYDISIVYHEFLHK